MDRDSTFRRLLDVRGSNASFVKYGRLGSDSRKNMQCIPVFQLLPKHLGGFWTRATKTLSSQVVCWYTCDWTVLILLCHTRSTTYQRPQSTARYSTRKSARDSAARHDVIDAAFGRQSATALLLSHAGGLYVPPAICPVSPST